MTDASGGSAGTATKPLVEQAVVACGVCGAWNDVWAEACVCGSPLLADTRKLKLSKSGGEPRARLERRAKHNGESTEEADWEQAVRDLAALRAAEDESPLTPRIAKLLLKLDRLSEASAQARLLADAGTLPADIVVGISEKCEAVGELETANGWIETGLQSCGDDLKGRIPLLCERSRLLVNEGNAPEALRLIEPLEGELEAAIKTTEKSGGATVGAFLGADPKSYATSLWSAESAALNTALVRAKGVVKELQRAQRAAEKQARSEQRAAEGKTHWWQP